MKHEVKKQLVASLCAPVKPGSVKLLLACLFIFWGFANAISQPVQLQLKDALNYALTANQNARKAKLDVENSQYRIDEVKARALPQVNGSGALNYNPLLQLSALPGELNMNNPGQPLLIAFGQKWNSNLGVSLSQTLYDQSVFTGLKAARTTSEFYRQNLQLTEEQLIEQVATNYYQVLVQRQKMSVLDSTIKITAKVQSILQGQYENGLAKKIDVDRIAVNFSNLRSSRQQLINALALMENQLKFLMGMPIETPIIIPEVSLNAIQPKAVPASENASIEGRTELAVLATQESLLNYQKEAYKSEYYPSLALNGSYSYQGLGNTFPVFKGVQKGANWFDVASVGLSLRVPIFNGFATKSRLRQADVSIRKLQEDITSTRLSLNLAYENAKTQINNSIITLSSQRTNVELAQQIFFNTQNNYNNGLAPLTDLLSAENSLTEAQNNYSAALLDYRIAEIQLIKSQGTLRSLLN
ncbi:TolC family protein [Segetibacter sp. 3557_3]|uniref:TolC family protein n=1 Tax=Segetibacter sp. 3557_3 TaxID=2547429 RepID=UPI0010586F9C|nr:TolC family protein [Segetibacter sp. 3557_3]TDH28774.1 TolC family protein [Segetibacter sp. 3557_3]